MQKKSYSITLLASLALGGSTFLSSTGAYANCLTVGTTVTCTTAGGAQTTIVGSGPAAGNDGINVDVQSGASISVGNTAAISLHDNATINVAGGATVTNVTAPSGAGSLYPGAGPNTIEFNSNGTLTVSAGGSVIETGTHSSAEAVNVMGFGNTILNHGLIQAKSSAAIWFQDRASGARNIVDNYGTIEKVGGIGSVIGASGNAGIVFINRTGAKVIGDLSFANGNDDLTFEAGSSVTGGINGGGGTNNLTLQGAGGSDDTLRGDIKNFSTLTKDGEGKWTITGSLSGFTIATVKDGTLALTGNNAGYTGSVVVESAGILEARAQSLPTKTVAADNVNNVRNDGLVRFTQSDDGTYIGQIVGSGSVEKVGAGVLTLAPVTAAGNTYSGGTTIKEGTIAAGADNVLGNATGGITFDGGTLRFDQSFDLSATRALTVAAGGGTIDTQSFTSTITQGTTGAGKLTKAGTGTLVLTGNNAHVGGTDVNAGTLALDTGASLSGGGQVNIATAGTLGGYGSVTGNVANNGSIAIADAVTQFTDRGTGNFTINGALTNTGTVQIGGSATGNNLLVNGNYIGDGGTIALNTSLGDDASPTDQLRVSGNTSGTSVVKVTNINGQGAPTNNGIQIINIGGASDGVFSLAGDYVFHGEQAVVGGAYSYTLAKNGKTTPNDGHWYLRSELTNPPVIPPIDPMPIGPIYQPGVPSYEAYAQTLQSLNGLPTLQQRVGNRYWSIAGNMMIEQGDGPGLDQVAPSPDGSVFIEGPGIWGRIEGSHSKFDPRVTTSGTEYDINTLKLQAGVDGMLHETENGKLLGGITVHYGHAKTNTRSVYGNGDISTDGYGFGGTLTWYGTNGFYIDTQAQVTWYDSDLNSKLANTGLVSGNNGFGYALSVETGKRVEFNDGWSVTPQAQLVYSSVDFDTFDDVFGARVSLDDGDSLNGRLGLSLDHESSWMGNDGNLNLLHAYGIANLYYEFLDASRVDVAGTKFISQNDRVWGGLGFGGSYNWAGDKYSLYGEGSVNTSLNNFGDSYTIKGNIGLRIKW